MGEQVGVWLVGARGAVATTAVAGAAALRSGLAPATGLVTALPPFGQVGLPDLDDLVFGGHELAETPLSKRAEALAAAGVLPDHLAQAVAEDLAAADAAIRPGIDEHAAASSPRQALRHIRGDLEAFRKRHALGRVVVVNVSTTEAPLKPHRAHQDLDALNRAIGEGRGVLPPSSLYAYAALDAGCPFVDFTPSAGARLPALEELSRRRGVPHAGRDAKTGQTLVRAALAPLFAARNLRVTSWAGTNLLGGGDGAALAEPHRAQSKLRSKAAGLPAILAEEVEAPLRIEYVQDLGVWKVAWDHVGFQGFLGTRMGLQLTWQGCDPALAAPLVLDLARLVARAHHRGHVGALAPLAFFFKDPVGTSEHRLEAQFGLLCAWAASLAAGGAG